MASALHLLSSVRSDSTPPRRAWPAVAVALACTLALAACTRDAPPPTTGGATEASAGTAASSTAGPDMPANTRPTADGPLALEAGPLAGQAEIGVRSRLGNPSGCEDVPKGRACRYAQAATEITYIDGTVDWIRVDDLGGAPFSAAALARVGLPTDEDPIESTPQLIRWQNLGGFREVTLHAGPAGRAARLELKRATL